MSHPIVTIDELARPVIDELVQISPGTTISFALTCRSLEELALETATFVDKTRDGVTAARPCRCRNRGAPQQNYREWVRFILGPHPIPILKGLSSCPVEHNRSKLSG